MKMKIKKVCEVEVVVQEVENFEPLRFKITRGMMLRY